MVPQGIHGEDVDPPPHARDLLQQQQNQMTTSGASATTIPASSTFNASVGTELLLNAIHQVERQAIMPIRTPAITSPTATRQSRNRLWEGRVPESGRCPGDCPASWAKAETNAGLLE